MESRRRSHMAQVILTQLEKTYPAVGKTPEFKAVRGIDLKVSQGEFMVLVGPSGCGKSTTLRMIAGLEDPTGGTITIDGKVVNDIAPKDRDIAMVFQNYALYPHMTVRENMAFGLKLRKMPKPEIETRVRDAASMLGLESMLDRLPKALSGGQRQRVAVGRAIVRQPKVFLFDEPLSNLDAKMRVAMRAEISRLHDRLGATMIYVTHDQVEAMTMGDRICVMKDGRIMQVDAPLALYNTPANLYTAGFIGSPPMNLIHGRLLREEDTTWFTTVSHASGAIKLALPTSFRDRIPADGRPLVLGIRPEDILVPQAAIGNVKAVVELAEPMGAETFLHIRAGGDLFIARVPPGRTFTRGEMLDLSFPAEKLRIFDATTESLLV